VESTLNILQFSNLGNSTVVLVKPPTLPLDTVGNKTLDVICSPIFPGAA